MSDNEPAQNVENPTGAQSAAGQASDIHDVSGTIFGAIFWIAVIAIGVIVLLRADRADILLNVSTSERFAVEGAVTFGGAPVAGGLVQVKVENAKSKRYLGSSTAPIGSGGRFKIESQNMLDNALLREPLRVIALFIGQYADKDAKSAKPLTGEQTVYINFTPPLGTQSLSLVTLIVVVLMIVLIVLFTGDLTRRKARALFSVTYFMTFLSLAVPIAVTLLVSQNLYLVEMMAEAPIGLIKGTAKGVISPQWMLNIGGSVRKPIRAEPAINPVENKDAGQPSDAAATSAPSDRPKTPAPDDARARPRIAEAAVDGGLAVPFYVIMLAMLGAGINMTRSVPKIQQDYDVSGLAQATRPLWKTTLTFFSSAHQPISTLDQRKAASSIRKGLIESYMYLLSAPFLAITVYYLLQVVAESVAEPVLVLMAFSTGLVSDTIISWLIEFARKTLKGSAEANGLQNQAPAGAAQQS